VSAQSANYESACNSYDLPGIRTYRIADLSAINQNLTSWRIQKERGRCGTTSLLVGHEDAVVFVPDRNFLIRKSSELNPEVQND
jgi:hypothetical protein